MGRMKKKRRKLTQAKVACNRCGKFLVPPNRHLRRWPCPHCGESTWNPKVSNGSLREMARSALAKLKKWDHRDPATGLVSCITCGKQLPWDSRDLDAGHFVRSWRGSTRYEWDNVQPQCHLCNRGRDGEYLAFAYWLRHNVGWDVPEELERKGRTTKQWTRLELIQLVEGLEANLRAEGLL